MAERRIPEHSIGRIFKRIEDIRVNGESKQLLKAQIEAWIEAIAIRSLVYMRHAKRRTVMEEDVALAIKDLFSD